MGMEDQIGTLEIGKEADLLVVNGDPLSDIGILDGLENIFLVMQAGKSISGPMSQQLPWEPTAPLKLWI
jgi:imidazolonepropionase-like amidohydrolase